LIRSDLQEFQTELERCAYKGALILIDEANLLDSEESLLQSLTASMQGLNAFHF
jgi:hypothetical protein